MPKDGIEVACEVTNCRTRDGGWNKIWGVSGEAFGGRVTGKFGETFNWFAGKDFSDAVAVENFAAETTQYIQYLRVRLARGNCPSDEPHRLIGYFWKWQIVRFDPEQLAASLSDDYQWPLGLQRLPVIRRSQYADAVAVETVAEDLGRYVGYLRDRLARGKRLPCHPRQLRPNFNYRLMFGDDDAQRRSGRQR